MIKVGPMSLESPTMDEVMKIDRLGANELEQCDFRVLRDPGCRGLVASTDGMVDGFLIYRKPQKLAEPLLVIIETVVVTPAARRMGVGRRLVNRVFRHVYRRRGATVEALVWERNLGALKFFANLGFVCSDIVKGSRCGDDDLVMICRSEWLPRASNL